MKHFGLAMAMGVICWSSWKWGVQVWSDSLWGMLGTGFWSRFTVRGVGIFALILEGICVLLILARLFQVEETLEATHFFWSRVNNKLKRDPSQG